VLVGVIVKVGIIVGGIGVFEGINDIPPMVSSSLLTTLVRAGIKVGVLDGVGISSGNATD
jgi:hypothetical protein